MHWKTCVRMLGQQNRAKCKKVWNSLAQQKLQIPKHEARSLWNITNTFFSAVFKSLLPRCCCWLKFLHKKPPTTENCNSQALLHFSLKVFSRISGRVEGDQTVIIPIISEIENPAIVGPSQNDGMSGLGTAAAQIVPDFRKNGFVAESGGGSMVMAIS